MLLLIWLFGFIALVFSKKNKFLNDWILILLWILFAFNYSSPDRVNYELIYQGVYSGYEPGFELLYRVFRQTGLSFQAFNIFIATLSFFFLYKGLRNFVNYQNRSLLLIFVFFFLYPFPILITTLRHTLSFSIAFYSLRYLWDERKGSELRFLLFIVLATSIHYSSAVFLLFLGINLTKRYKISPIFWITLAVLGMGISYTELIPIIMSKLFSSKKVLEWFGNRARLGIFLIITVQLYTFLCFFISYQKINNLCKTKSNSLRIIRQSRILTTIYHLNCMSFFLIPFYVFNAIFITRIYIMIIIVNYFVYAETLSNGKLRWKHMEKGLYIAMLFIQMIIYTLVLTGSDYFVLFRSLGNNLFLSFQI